MDIGFGAVTEPVDLIVSQTINSFRTVRRTGIVCQSDPAPWDDALEVQLYTGLNATGTLVGKLLYGHVSNMLTDAVRNTYFYTTGKKWFEAIARTSPDTCACGCYKGIHLHMQVDTGWSGYNSGLNASCTVQPAVAKGSTFLYEWFK